MGCGLVAGDATSTTIANECANQFPKVSTCLTFVTGQADAPTTQCCTSVADLKNANPVCLCYIIQQIHNGSNSQIKNMGIQEARLLQLPSACHMANASTAECPKLLNLPPNSPDAAIFSNSTASTTPSGSATPSSPETATPTAATKNSGSSGFKHGPQLAGPVAIAVAIFFCSFPTGLKIMSTFSTQ
ncbi:hypothetical protein ACH5RR_035462 [Cinchona calisaya]|uniref:Bifunctional inhibitor/plant lipid transfer protein/seed storage helical domain-containing protein n=1 Tax=Cinchona calisaya TaxID=153742 RepID=A0ABD2Y0J8_9GENT